MHSNDTGNLIKIHYHKTTNLTKQPGDSARIYHKQQNSALRALEKDVGELCQDITVHNDSACITLVAVFSGNSAQYGQNTP